MSRHSAQRAPVIIGIALLCGLFGMGIIFIANTRTPGPELQEVLDAVLAAAKSRDESIFLTFCDRQAREARTRMKYSSREAMGSLEEFNARSGRPPAGMSRTLWATVSERFDLEYRKACDERMIMNGLFDEVARLQPEATPDADRGSDVEVPAEGGRVFRSVMLQRGDQGWFLLGFRNIDGEPSTIAHILNKIIQNMEEMTALLRQKLSDMR